jgi:CBS-domain-containing membrane protein
MKPTITESRIHTKVTLDGNGEGRSSRHVFCKRAHESVDLRACQECPWVEGWPETFPGAEVVRCHASFPPVAATADLREKTIRTPVGEVMGTNVACVRADADMDMLGRLLGEDGLDAVPVVDAKGHPMGIICKTDLLRALRDRDELAAKDVMTPLVHALHEGAPVSFALAMLASEKIEQVPVVSKDGVLVGLFTSNDAIRFLARELGYAV